MGEQQTPPRTAAALEGSVGAMTAYSLYLVMATQDMAEDGRVRTMRSAEDVGHALGERGGRRSTTRWPPQHTGGLRVMVRGGPRGKAVRGAAPLPQSAVLPTITEGPRGHEPIHTRDRGVTPLSVSGKDGPRCGPGV